MATLASQIVSDVTGTFLDTDDFANNVEFWPKGVEANKVAAKAVINFDWLPGTNEVAGDGVVNNRQGQRRERQSSDLYCAATLAVQDEQIVDHRDIFKILDGPYANELVAVKRKLGEDAGMLRLRVIRSGNLARQRFERTG